MKLGFTTFNVFLVSLFCTGCVTVHPQATSLAQASSGSVILVGRVELVPPLAAEEQQIDTGIDPLNVKDHYLGRAVLFLSDRPVYQERTKSVVNPPLEQTWFVAVPANQRYLVRGSVIMDYAHRATSRRSVTVDQTELLMPGMVEFDMQAADRAIYVGTMRLYRDEFHSVTKAEIIDDYPAALREFRNQFGAESSLRKALARPVRDHTARTDQR